MAGILVTVLHGKTALTRTAALEATNWLDALKHEVAQATGVAVAHQKLVFRGKELVAWGSTNPLTSLVNSSRIMLLKNKAFYDDPHAAASLHAASGSSNRDGDQFSSHKKAIALASVVFQGGESVAKSVDMPATCHRPEHKVTVEDDAVAATRTLDPDLTTEDNTTTAAMAQQITLGLGPSAAWIPKQCMRLHRWAGCAVFHRIR